MSTILLKTGTASRETFILSKKTNQQTFLWIISKNTEKTNDIGNPYFSTLSKDSLLLVAIIDRYLQQLSCGANKIFCTLDQFKAYESLDTFLFEAIFKLVISSL